MRLCLTCKAEHDRQAYLCAQCHAGLTGRKPIHQGRPEAAGLVWAGRSDPLDEFSRRFAELASPEQHWYTTLCKDGVYRQLYTGPTDIEQTLLAHTRTSR